MYTAYVGRDPAEATSLPPVADEQRAAYLQVPPGHERHRRARAR